MWYNTRYDFSFKKESSENIKVNAWLACCQYSQYRFSTDNQSLFDADQQPITVSFNTANTWASFVIPLVAFGICNYGIRAISKVRDD